MLTLGGYLDWLFDEGFLAKNTWLAIGVWGNSHFKAVVILDANKIRLVKKLGHLNERGCGM